MVLIRSQWHQGRRLTWPWARPTVAYTTQYRVFHLINSIDIFNKDTSHFHSFMCDLSVVATKNTKQECQGSLADEAKLPLALLFYFSCEYQWPGRQRLLVILPVSVTEGTHFWESLGRNYNVIACSLGSSQPHSLPSESSCQHSPSAQRLCWWAPESPQELGAAVTPLSSQFCCEKGAFAGTRGQRKAIGNPQAPLWASLAVLHKREDFGFWWRSSPSTGEQKDGDVSLYSRQANESLVGTMSVLKPKEKRVGLVDFSVKFRAFWVLLVFFSYYFIWWLLFLCIRNSVSCQTRLLIDLFFLCLAFNILKGI